MKFICPIEFMNKSLEFDGDKEMAPPPHKIHLNFLNQRRRERYRRRKTQRVVQKFTMQFRKNCFFTSRIFTLTFGIWTNKFYYWNRIFCKWMCACVHLNNICSPSVIFCLALRMQMKKFYTCTTMYVKWCMYINVVELQQSTFETII